MDTILSLVTVSQKSVKPWVSFIHSVFFFFRSSYFVLLDLTEHSSPRKRNLCTILIHQLWHEYQYFRRASFSRYLFLVRRLWRHSPKRMEPIHNYTGSKDPIRRQKKGGEKSIVDFYSEIEWGSGMKLCRKARKKHHVTLTWTKPEL